MELARRDLKQFWEALNLSGNPVAVRNALLDFFPELIAVYGDVAALLGADWFDELRNAPPSASSFRAVMGRNVNVEQAVASVRWAIGPLFGKDPNPLSALKQLDGVAQKLVLQPGRDTVFESALKDPSNVRFARIPSGFTTCTWCTMLASRGFVYRSAEDAGQSNQWHGNCDCVITPGRGPDDFPEGHDVREYKRLYREGLGVGEQSPAK